MKKVILSSLLLLGVYSYAQVGVNTTAPQSTLDVTAKNATGTTTNVDGLLVPRVDRQRAQSMTTIPTSTLIYVNNVATGTQTGTAVNIDTIGHYFYDGTVWTKLNNSSGASSTSINIYNTDGSLTGNRTVNQAANTLTFAGTAVNAFSVDGSTLSVDAANHRLGIGTAAPTTTLDVNGTQRVRSLNNATSDATYTRNVVADANGNLGYTTRSSGKPTPATYTGSMAINAAPVTVATGVSLSEFTPIITSFSSTSDVNLATYRFFDSGGNIMFDLLTPNNATVYSLTIKFIRNN